MALVALLAQPALAGVWSETGDAGDSLAGAQLTVGSGSLDTITGTIASLGDVDMYCIRVTDTQAFNAFMTCTVVDENDLWLFDQNGFGLAANDGCQFSVIDITDQFVTSTGVHYLAVSASEVEALSSGGPIWSPLIDVSEMAPDGTGAAFALSGWDTTQALLIFPNYTITLVGATFCDSPVPTENTTWGRVKSLYK